MCAKKVYVGLSGGVDSSVSAALLVEHGYDVTGVYMKNWSRDLPGMKCPWAEDLADAKRVAVKLGIDFKVFDFETEYKAKVVDYMVAEYKAGRTPNPDIMCNQEVKFKLFLETSLTDGADMIATGHYARIVKKTNSSSSNLSFLPSRPNVSACNSLGIDAKELQGKPIAQKRQIRTGGWRDDGVDGLRSGIAQKEQADGRVCLVRSVDERKDQTYFLYRVTEEALEKVIFPVGGMLKSEVRELASKYGLATAGKKESMGVCFVGNVGIKEFLGDYVEKELGEIRDEATEKVLGYHEGVVFYTIGQRHGLDVGGGLPYYVSRKDMDKNVVYVTTNLNSEELWRKEVLLRDVHFIGGRTEGRFLVRVRHQAALVEAGVSSEGEDLRIVFDDPQRALVPGQSVVIYDGMVCLGGGVVA